MEGKNGSGFQKFEPAAACLPFFLKSAPASGLRGALPVALRAPRPSSQDPLPGPPSRTPGPSLSAGSSAQSWAPPAAQARGVTGIPVFKQRESGGVLGSLPSEVRRRWSDRGIFFLSFWWGGEYKGISNQTEMCCVQTTRIQLFYKCF